MPNDFESSLFEKNFGTPYGAGRQADFGNLLTIHGTESEATLERGVVSQSAGRLDSTDPPNQENGLPYVELAYNDGGKPEEETEAESETGANLETDDEESDQERQERFTKLFKEITGQESSHADGPEKELNAWADSWKDFVETQEVPEGDFRNLIQDFGSQLMLATPDSKQLASYMNHIEDTQEIKDTLQDLNRQLRANGLELSLDFDKNGKMTGMELATLEKEGEVKTSLRINSSGEITSTGKDEEGKPLSQEEAVKQLAKRASPLACP